MSEQSLKTFSRWAVGLWNVPFVGGVGLIDLLLLTTGVLLFAGSQLVPWCHIIFIWLAVGAFFWPLRAFLLHSVVWGGMATIAVLQSIARGQMAPAELTEIPLLTIMLVVVYMIAQWRAQAQAQFDEANTELARVHAKLTELDTLKTKFMADITHELRTPLTNLSLYIDLLKSGRGENQQRYLSVIKKQSNQLVKITEDIIGVSALALSRAKWDLKAIDLNQTVGTVLDSFVNNLPDHTRLVFDAAPNIAPVLGEKEHLYLAVTKLVDNAVKYTPSGLVRITTWEQPEDNCVGLEIADTGIGISAEDMPHIFERLYRGSNVSQSNIPGSGLGLTLARELIQLHNGFIELTSDEGHGTIVRVMLPAAVSRSKPTDDTIIIRATRLWQRPR